MVWNARTARRQFSLPTASSGIDSVAYSSDGRYLVTTLLNDSLEVWNAKS